MEGRRHQKEPLFFSFRVKEYYTEGNLTTSQSHLLISETRKLKPRKQMGCLPQSYGLKIYMYTCIYIYTYILYILHVYVFFSTSFSESDQCDLISSLLKSRIQPKLTIIHSLRIPYTFLRLYHCPHLLECHTPPP